MCHAYSITTNVEALRQFVRDVARLDVAAAVGNMEPQTGIYPAMVAPIIRCVDQALLLDKVWWGMPTPQNALWKNAKRRADKLIERRGRQLSPDDFEALQQVEPDPGVHNVRNTDSAHWRRWLAPEYRVVVPFNSFAEWDNTAGVGGKKLGNTWFAFDDDRPLAFFAGIMAPQWTSVRRVGQEAITTDLFAFLTTEANDVVGRHNPDSMPVILRTADEVQTWLTARWPEARKLQRPLPPSTLKVVSVGPKEDPEPVPDQSSLF